jgi:hypothetical protein
LAFAVSWHIKRTRKKELSSRCDCERTWGSQRRDEPRTDQETAVKRRARLNKKKRSTSRSDTKWTQTVSPHTPSRFEVDAPSPTHQQETQSLECVLCESFGEFVFKLALGVDLDQGHEWIKWLDGMSEAYREDLKHTWAGQRVITELIETNPGLPRLSVPSSPRQSPEPIQQTLLDVTNITVKKTPPRRKKRTSAPEPVKKRKQMTLFKTPFQIRRSRCSIEGELIHHFHTHKTVKLQETELSLTNEVLQPQLGCKLRRNYDRSSSRN